MKNNKEISVSVSWLETLVRLAERAEKDMARLHSPSSVSALIGYAGSAGTILKFKKHDN